MKELVIKVWGSNTYKRTYFNSVSCDGVNLIAPWGAPGNSYRGVEVLEVVGGGYTSGDGRHAWDAEYTLRIRCSEDAEIKTVGRQLNGSSGYRILKESVNA
jgi:hypothetical protein